jgi:cyclohexa-1,5-dienecarbonyl-CoA hydratase
MNASKVRVEAGGRIVRVVLAAPKANILDQAMVSELTEAWTALAPRRDLAAVVLQADGPHFSFGASVQEHLPGQVDGMLKRFHALLRQIAAAPAPTIAAVRGQCLGGGFELALACDLILAEETAQLGCPEIKLAVFPPAACVLLPLRVGSGRAAQLALTGASWSGSQAAAAGLVNRAVPAGELEQHLEQCLRQDLLPLSPAALRHAVSAVRAATRRALEEELPKIERLYLERLMAEPDAEEGLRAFLEKRPPRWGSGGGL